MWDFIKDNSISFIALIISIIGFFKDNIMDIINAFKNKIIIIQQLLLSHI